MSKTLPRNYQSISAMNQEEATGEKTVPGRNFYVHLAGKTNHAHQGLVDKFKGVGQKQVYSPEESDYLLVFCPSPSRVGTDISEALDNMPDGGQPVILVVMHHTFSPDHVVAPSRRQVDNARVILTVDTLFYENAFLKADRNDIAWYNIQKNGLGLFPSQVSTGQGEIGKWRRTYLKLAVIALGLGGLAVVAVVIWKFVFKHE